MVQGMVREFVISASCDSFPFGPVTVLSLLEDVGYSEFVVSEVNLEYQTSCDLKMDMLLIERWQQIRAESAFAAPTAETAIDREVTDGDRTTVA